MTKCNTDQLINPETMEYLTKRQMELVKDQQHWEAMMQEKGNVIFTMKEIYSMVKETKARRNELALMVTCLEKEETDKRQKALDDFEHSLAGDGYPDGEGQAPSGMQHENGEL